MTAWLVIVFMDWSYWKTAPHSLHTLIVYGIIFTYLFLRLAPQAHIKDVEGLLKQLHYLPRAIAASLAAINSLVLTIRIR